VNTKRSIGFVIAGALAVVAAAANFQRRAHPRPLRVVPDDATLKARVLTEVLGDPATPKGAVVVDVLDGMVTLRGQLASSGEIARIEDRTLSVIGVRGVESLLHLPDVDPANKAVALKAS
jgi:osmotically-inducible protein OsmY